MAFSILVYLSLVLFIAGLIYRASTWFTRNISIHTREITPFERMCAAGKGIVRVIFSRTIMRLISAFILDVVIQRKILKESTLRWIMHTCIWVGFTMLLIWHALGDIITVRVNPDYASTLNPFMFLRNLFGFILLVGLGIAAYRRFFQNVPRFKSNVQDKYALIILAVIVLSGILLEGVKITSHNRYTEMVETYADTDDEDELRTLEMFWVQYYSVVSPTIQPPLDEEMLEQGREQHEMSCAACHSPPSWAFTGYIFARMIKPFALQVDQANISTILWFIHVLACFAGLVYVPFSKMLHIITVPLHVIAGAVVTEKPSDPANQVTKHMIGLDACTHCGTCSLYCSAMMAYHSLGNDYILPSEKIQRLKNIHSYDTLSSNDIRTLQQGVYLCTNCDRCTVVCPSGINLKDLWIDVREALVQKGVPEPLSLSPFSLLRGLQEHTLTEDFYTTPLKIAYQALADRFDQLMDTTTPLVLPLQNNAECMESITEPTFSYCFQCQNCTTVCPVVENYQNPQEILGLLPHQIMCALGLGLTEMALGPKMLWDCVTCYLCQEHCPQKVKVTDILFDLKNLSIKRHNQRSAP